MALIAESILWRIDGGGKSVDDSAMEFHAYTGIDLQTIGASVGGPIDGLPVLLLHGGGQTRHAWRHAAADLARAGRRVISLDLRGHGDSAWAADGNYGFDAFVGDLRAVLATVSRAPVLVGASLGGLTSLLVAGEPPQPQLRALVLVDVVPRLEREGVMQIVRFMQAYPHGFVSLDEAAEAVAAYLPHRPRPGSSGGLSRNLRSGRDGRLHWHWDPNLLVGSQVPDPEPAIARFETAAAAIKVPTLLVRGARSEMVSEQGVRDFLKLIPSAEFVDVQEAGHMVAGDDNDAFNEAVERFLDRLD